MELFNYLSKNSSEIFELVKEISDKVGYDCYKDRADNIIIHNSGNGDRVLVPFIVEKEELLITSIKDNNVYFTSNTNIELEVNTNIYINNNKIGYIKNTEEKHIIVNNKNDVKKGEKAYIKSGVLCKANKLYGRNVKSNISIYFVVKLIEEAILSDKDIYFTLSFSKNAAKVLPDSIKPDFIFNTYYDEVSENFVLSKGSGIAYKDGGAVIGKEMLDLYKKCSKNIKHQAFFGKTGSLTEYFSLCESGIKSGAIIIPVKNLNKSCEIASADDINSALLIYKNLLTCEV